MEQFPQQVQSHSSLQYFCYMMAKHQTFERSTKDHYALCPRVNCNRHTHTQPQSTYLQCAGQSCTVSPFYIYVGKCTSQWFPERLLGSQSPISPLNAAGPGRRQGSISLHHILFENRVETLFPFNVHGPNQIILPRK